MANFPAMIRSLISRRRYDRARPGPPGPGRSPGDVVAAYLAARRRR